MAENKDQDKSQNLGSDAMGMDDQERNKQGQNQSNQSKSNNPGNFANDPDRAAEAGRKGGQS